VELAGLSEVAALICSVAGLPIAYANARLGWDEGGVMATPARRYIPATRAAVPGSVEAAGDHAEFVLFKSSHYRAEINNFLL
jgi:hypothetical protein